MSKRDGTQQGPQTHGEGQHGEKTTAAFIENLHARHPDTEQLDAEQSDAVPAHPDADVYGRPTGGRHRLVEDRQQHDDAEKNSEANRLRR
jgi:hypothetical protein